MIVEPLFGMPRRVVGIAEASNIHCLGPTALVEMAAEAEGVEAVQLLACDLVAGPEHLLSAAQNALNAWRGGYQITRSLATEILVCASGQRQIHRAIDTLGVYDGIERVAVVVVAHTQEQVRTTMEWVIERIGREVEPPFVHDEIGLRRIMEHFGVSEVELAAIAESDALEDRQDALARCVAGRVTGVLIES